jgi:hypothetical protein
MFVGNMMVFAIKLVAVTGLGGSGRGLGERSSNGINRDRLPSRY